MDYSVYQPFPDAQRTGHTFITPCYTAGTVELLLDGVSWLVCHVAALGWGTHCQGRIEDINRIGPLPAADGTERPVRWQPGKDGRDSCPTTASPGARVGSITTEKWRNPTQPML